MLKKLLEPVQVPEWIVKKYRATDWVQPYYIIFGGILGAVSAVLGGIILIIVLVVTNFNLLGWME